MTERKISFEAMPQAILELLQKVDSLHPQIRNL